MTTGAPVVPSTPKTSGLAITSLILGIVGGCTLGLLSIVGLILGIMAAKKIKASGGTIGGRGLAIAGIIVSILTLIIGLAIAAIVGAGALLGVAGLSTAKDFATQAMCENNLRQLCGATLNYTNNSNGEFPTPTIWPSVLKEGGYMSDDGILTCPGKGNAGRAYAMNAKLGGVRMTQVRNSSRTVLFFECSPGAPPSGGPSDLPPEPTHTGGWIIGFCDAHTELVPLNGRDQLIWEPLAQ